MVVMYVDESGTPSSRDHTEHFILAGVIVYDDRIKALQKHVLEYKHTNFRDADADTEIRTYSIYQARGDFKSLDQITKMRLLDELYELIRGLECAGIVVVINKNKFQIEHPTWNITDTAWRVLLKKYKEFLQDNSANIGRIVVDKSSNKLVGRIRRAVQSVVARDLKLEGFSRLEQPKFVDSSGVFGIQVADVFSYSAIKHKTGNRKFVGYWDIILDKLVKNKSGDITGYVEL